MLSAVLASLRRARDTVQFRAAFDEFLERISAGGIAAQAIKSGDAMPGFLLPDTAGRLVNSAELLARGPLVVTFFRGGWCPYCSATLDAMQAEAPGITASGGTLVALTPETGGRAMQMQDKHGLIFPVLADVDLAVAMAFGIVFRTPPLYAALLRHGGVDLAARSGNPAWMLPIPAAFLVRQDGIVARSWVNPDSTQRAEPADILSALRSL